MPDSSSFLVDPSAAGCTTEDPHIVVGALPLAVVLDQKTVLLSGWTAVPLPASGTVQFGDDAARGTWRATAWSTGEGNAQHIIAVLQAENIVRAQTLPLVLSAADGRRLALPEIVRVELEAGPLLTALRGADADLSSVFDFVKDILTAADAAEPPSSRVRGFLLAFLGAISVHDGFIEIVGRPECGGLLLQGWSMHLQPGALDFGLLSKGLEIHEAAVACFERSDLLSTASGLLAFMKTARTIDLQMLTRVYFKSKSTYFHLDLVESRLVLREQTTPHLKDMLDRLRGPASAVRALKRVCRPLFPGHETISTMTTPVRFAHDVVLHAQGGGILISGWLLDPRKSVRMVLLKSTANFYARIDRNWVRLPRPDVTAGFASDPMFAECLRPWDTQHGFLAFVPRPQPLAANEIHYLELVLEDESCAFLPIRFSDVDPQTMLQQILGAVNIDDPDIDRIVSTHLGPLVAALSSGSRPLPAVSSASFGHTAEEPVISVVVPLAAGWADFDINLARYAADPDFHHAELVVVAPRSSGDQIAQSLRRYASFYGIGGTLVLTDEPLDHHSALEAGARVARTGLLLFLSASVFPRESGWLGHLVEQLRKTPDAGAASPTLLYEDDSVRFAGTGNALTNLDGSTGDRFRGYGHHWLNGEEARPVASGDADCCIVRREVFFALGGFSNEFVCPELRSRDFGLRLQAAGSKFYWTPSLRLYALDDQCAEPEDYWMRVRRLVDRWGFARKWSADSLETSC